MVFNPPLPDPHDAAVLADALRPAVLKLGRQLRREAQKVGVSAVDSQLLAIVGRTPGIGVSELAAMEQVSSPSMSAHVKRLVADGWLEREASADGDQRRVRLVLTEKARASMAAIRQHRTEWLFARLTLLAPEERDALAAAVAPMLRLAGLRE